MHYLRLIVSFARLSMQAEMAFQTNFWINFLNSTLNLATGVLGVWVLFGQIDEINGWNLASTLTILGVYLLVSAFRNLFMGPSLDTLAGMDGEVWTGKFDFTLLRPLDIQFQASFRHWRPWALIDLLFGVIVIYLAGSALGASLVLETLITFVLALSCGMLVLYSILLVFAGLVFWSPGFLFTWVFDGLFQMARYPVGVYPGYLRWLLTWLIPIGLITTVPAQALTGDLESQMAWGSALFAGLLFLAASWFFRRAVRRYASASS
jgi:ABC-2 type transport system permease protein